MNFSAICFSKTVLETNQYEPDNKTTNEYDLNKYRSLSFKWKS